MNNWNDGSENYNLQFKINELECQLAEAQQAFAGWKNDAEIWAERNAMLNAERDTLRGLLREALALIRVAHHWDKLSEVRSFCERTTAALKENE